VTQPNGKTYTAEFNSRGATTAKTDTLGQKTSTKLDAQNRVTERTDSLGRTWKYQYDAKGNITQVTDPLNRVTTTTYDPLWNRPTSVSRFDEANQPQTWSFTYDPAKGMLLTATDPLNHTTSFAYTARGQLERMTNALNHATRFEYNSSGDLVKVIDALLNETRYGVDGVGRRILTADPLSNTTRTAYNGTGRVTRITDARNQQTQLAYDPAGRLDSVTNPRNFVIQSYGYDAGDRLTSRTDAKSRQTLYDYDPAGRLERVTDRRGQVTTYTYDDDNRIVSVTRPEGVTRYSYDAGGRVREVSEPAGTIVYEYDTVDRLIRESQTNGGTTNIVEYAYDALDRRTSRTVVGVAGEVTSYGYDRANRLTSIVYRGQTTTIEYDANGRVTRRILPNDIRQEFAYDEADRLLALGYKNPDDSTIETIAYGYDAAGRRVSESRSTNPLPDSAFTAQYDEADRMTSITLTATGQTFVLGYDENGNLVSKLESGSPANQVSYTWDSRNRLTGVSGPALAASFEYDAMGRRIARTVNGVTTRYIYDGLQALGEVINGVHVGLLTGLDLDEAIARYSGPEARIFLSDALNTVFAQTRADRSVQNYYAYSPYGEVSVLGPDDGNATQYTARENDLTGLYYYRARYYDPLLKRFIAEDPMGLAAGLNRYAYVSGDPVSYADPLGLWSPGAHNIILKTALPNLTPTQLYWVQRGSQQTDFVLGQFDKSGSAEHAMRAPGQSVDAARQQMCDFIRSNLRDFYANVNSPIPSLRQGAYRALGRALHPVMDSTSPAHQNFPEWHLRDALSHGDSPYSLEDEAHLTPQLLQKTVDLINGVMSAEDPCKCFK
jgi:RHS repeat-associated protein